jgi:hypothetical protein
MGAFTSRNDGAAAGDLGEARYTYDAARHHLLVRVTLASTPSALAPGAACTLLRDAAADVFRSEFPNARHFAVESCEWRGYESTFPYTLQAQIGSPAGAAPNIGRACVMCASSLEDLTGMRWAAPRAVTPMLLEFAGWTRETLAATMRPAPEAGYVLVDMLGPLRRFAEAAVIAYPPPAPLSGFVRDVPGASAEHAAVVQIHARSMEGRAHAALPLCDANVWKLPQGLANELVAAILEYAETNVRMISADALGVAFTRFDGGAWSACKDPDVARIAHTTLSIVLYAVEDRSAAVTGGGAA